MLTRSRRSVSGEIPVASTADIAFLLLIFFLVSTTFPKDKGLAIVLPAPSEQVEVSQRDILHLAIRLDGVVEVKRGESQQIQEIRPREVEGLWRQEFASNPSLVAAIRTHPEAPYRFTVDVLDALQSANAQRISLQVLELGP
ncbi:MAG: ExbD/TolR family protein [Longimicrobiales bacterium]